MKAKIIVSKRIEELFNLRIKDWLIEQNIPFMEIEDLPHYLKDEDLKDEDSEFFIAVNIHSMNDYPKQFCVHPPGNWGSLWPHPKFSNLGGEKATLSKSSAALLKEAYLSILRNNKLEQYKVNIECTHHGPNISKPLVFLEIGCSPNEWEDNNALDVIKKVILDLQNPIEDKKNASIVIGGGHYMKNVQELLKKGNVQVSHMCPSSQLHALTAESIKEAVEKSYEKVESFIIDLEGVGQHKDRIVELLKEANQKYEFMHEMR